MTVNNWISLLSGVAFFLFGMSLMGDGLKKVAGSKLELILYRLTSNPLKGVLLGTGVTAVIQSSSATSVMVVGFVNSGMMKIRQAIGIIMGAILGTSVTGWLLCLSDLGGAASGWVELLSTATITGLVAVVGIILHTFCKGVRKKQVGSILLGFGVLMMGMQTMSAAVSSLKESEAFIQLLTRFSDPFLGILVGILVTCVLQSASASVGILQAIAITGAIDFSVAFPLILGIAIGAAVPVLLSAIGANINARRTAYTYLLIDALGVAIWGAVFYLINGISPFPFMNATMNTASIAMVNTLFRLATVLILTPAIPLLEKMVCRLLPAKADELEDMAEIDCLEDRFINHPSLAVEQSKRALCGMAERAEKNLERAMSLLSAYSEEQFELIQEKEEVIDRYEDKLGTYLVKLTGQEMGEEENKEISKFLHTISDFERIGDHAVNIAKVAREIEEKKLSFSPEAEHELSVVQDAVAAVVNISFRAFTTEDITLAYRVEPLEELIDDLCDELKLHHVSRVQSGNCTLHHGFVFNDLLTNYERIADHCSNIAVAMIELESDAFDTHEYLNSIKRMKSGSFNAYFEEYRKQFSL